MFLFVFLSPTISVTRDKLLDIRQHTMDICFRILFIQMLCWMFWSAGSGPSQTRAQTEKREARWLSSANAASESQAFISRISDPSLTKRINYF